MTVQLPPNPKEDDYEDLVSAIILAQGYFRESSIELQRDGLIILEFDAVATPTNENWKDSIVIEAKSGKSAGFPEIFKLYGWMKYTNRTSGVLVHLKPMRESMLESLPDVSSATGVRCVHLDPSKPDVNQFLAPCRDVDDRLKTIAIHANRYGLLARRAMLKELHREQENREEWVSSFKKYRNGVNSAIFIESSITRINKLYSEWQRDSNLPGRAVADLVSETGSTKNIVWRDLRTDFVHPWLQYAMAFDHIARLRILRSAVDLSCSDDANDCFEQLLLPESFREALSLIKQDENRHQVPYLLQIFFEILGGFYRISDDSDREIKSLLSGIPVNRIDECLSYYDRFFPFDGGWFFEQGKGEIKRAKVVPAITHGVGCFFRQKYFKVSDYDEICPEMGWLLGKWHQSLYECVHPILGVDN